MPPLARTFACSFLFFMAPLSSRLHYIGVVDIDYSSFQQNLFVVFRLVRAFAFFWSKACKDLKEISRYL